MARRKKVQKTYRYKCTITDEEFKTTKQASNPEELISVAAFYDLNPDRDDRPKNIINEEMERIAEAKKAQDLLDELAAAEAETETEVE